jgi:hypothetical protein
MLRPLALGMARRRVTHSMGSDQLPWEASETALELLRQLRRCPWPGAWKRPDVGLVAWYWKMTLAAPDAPIDTREQAARQLRGWEILGKRDHPRDLEWFLAFRGWAEGDKAEYQNAADGSTLEDPDPIRLWSGASLSTPAGDYYDGQIQAAAEVTFGLPDHLFEKVKPQLMAMMAQEETNEPKG